MPKNLINLFIAGALLLLVSACFFSTDRNTGSRQTVPESEATPPEQARAQPADDRYADKGEFKVVELRPAASRFRTIESRIKTEKLLEKAADRLNRSLKLPYDIGLEAVDCGEQNAFYEPKEKRVTICYELMNAYTDLFRSAGADDVTATAKMFDAVRFVFLHEVGHALMDAYKLPITGNEEDAADRLSAYINLSELGDDGVKAILAAADAFRIESRQNRPKERDLAGEHLLQEQRLYNSLCMLYGSDPSKHAGLVDGRLLPKDRAEKCRSDYQRSHDSWTELLRPWRKA